MFYLIGQIFIILLVAAFAGIGVGWWARSLMRDMRNETALETEAVDPFGARSRLEQCHRDNANLRRDLLEAQEQLAQLKHVKDLTEDSDALSQLQQAESRVKALLDDLQARDDTIAILERELEQLRS